MSKYAVIKINKNQYKVSEKEEILIDKLNDKKPSCEVLLAVEGEKVMIGKPKVKGAEVKLKSLKDFEKGSKLYVSKYKAKSRYRKKIGFRPFYTRLLVEKITL